MQVQDICTRQVATCAPQTSLSIAGWTMWEHDCGVLPVVNDQGKVIGMLTDRDICMAVATKSRPACQINVGEVAHGKVYSCKPEDDVRAALRTMQTQQIRRLPVVDAEDKLKGMISLNDVTLATLPQRDAKASDITYDDLGSAVKAICQHRIPVKETVPAQSKVAVAQ